MGTGAVLRMRPFGQTTTECPTCGKHGYIPTETLIMGRRVRTNGCLTSLRSLLAGMNVGDVNGAPLAGHPPGTLALDYWSITEPHKSNGWAYFEIGFARREDGASWSESGGRIVADFSALGNLKREAGA